MEANWPAIAAIAEAVGALAVVLSLLYVARQVRHNTTQARLDAGSALVTRFTEIVESWSRDRTTIELFLRGSASYDTLDQVDQTRYRSLMLGFWRMLEDQYYLHRAGTLDPERWGAISRTMADYMQLPGIQRFLVDRGHWFTPTFIEFCWGLIDSRPADEPTPMLTHVAATRTVEEVEPTEIRES